MKFLSVLFQINQYQKIHKFAAYIINFFLRTFLARTKNQFRDPLSNFQSLRISGEIVHTGKDPTITGDLQLSSDQLFPGLGALP